MYLLIEPLKYQQNEWKPAKCPFAGFLLFHLVVKIYEQGPTGASIMLPPAQEEVQRDKMANNRVAR